MLCNASQGGNVAGLSLTLAFGYFLYWWTYIRFSLSTENTLPHLASPMSTSSLSCPFRLILHYHLMTSFSHALNKRRRGHAALNGLALMLESMYDRNDGLDSFLCSSKIPYGVMNKMTLIMAGVRWTCYVWGGEAERLESSFWWMDFLIEGDVREWSSVPRPFL